MRYRRGKRRETQNYIFMPTNTTLFKGQFKSGNIYSNHVLTLDKANREYNFP